MTRCGINIICLIPNFILSKAVKISYLMFRTYRAYSYIHTLQREKLVHIRLMATVPARYLTGSTFYYYGGKDRNTI